MPLLTDRTPDGSHITLTLSRHNSAEENAQLYAWHEDQEAPPGSLLRLDLRATPEFANRVRDLLRSRYGWTVELEERHLYFMRKPTG